MPLKPFYNNLRPPWGRRSPPRKGRLGEKQRIHCGKPHSLQRVAELKLQPQDLVATRKRNAEQRKKPKVRQTLPLRQQSIPRREQSQGGNRIVFRRSFCKALHRTKKYQISILTPPPGRDSLPRE